MESLLELQKLVDSSPFTDGEWIDPNSSIIVLGDNRAFMQYDDSFIDGVGEPASKLDLMVVDADFRFRGIGSDLFRSTLDKCQLNRIVCWIDERNLPMIQIARKFGFDYLGKGPLYNFELRDA